MKSNEKIFKTIISNTVIFISVMLFVSIFKSIFGDENTQIGITTIVLSLSLLSSDLTNSPFKNLIFLITFNVITILGAYIFESNLWLGLIVNFLILGGIGYLFTYDVKKPFNMLFGLQYILIIGTPVSATELPKRLVAGVVSASLVMALQLLVNKKKLVKSSNKFLILIKEKLILKINLIKENKNTDHVTSDINNLIDEFKLSIFESGQTDLKISDYGNLLIDILFCIEKANFLLDNIEDPYSKDKLSSIFQLLEKNINKLNTLEDSATSHLADDFKLIYRHKSNIMNGSYRVSYGLRIGILFALTGFITKLFDLEFGKWMMFTVFALTQPYGEFSYVKSKKRVFGTTIGALIIFAYFLIIKDNSLRVIILLVSGYLLAYFEDYKYKSIFITISATCIAAVNSINPFYVIVSRVIWVFIGVIISLIANKYLFPSKYKDAENELINLQKEASQKMYEEVLLSQNPNGNTIRNLFLIPSLIGNRATISDLNIEQQFITENKLFVNNIYQLYLMRTKNFSS